MNRVAGRSARLPAILMHSDDDTPVPTWLQVTRSEASKNAEMISHLTRIVSGADDEAQAKEIWSSWSRPQKRSVALLVDKICYEGWLDSVGRIDGLWDGGCFFIPYRSWPDLTAKLDAKTTKGGGYTHCSLRGGLTGFLSGLNHPGWKTGWIENDTPYASLHVGIFDSGIAEVHFDLFNPLHVVGAPSSDVAGLPKLGSYNRRLFRLHRKWEGPRFGALTRTSANLYHLMVGRVPLCF